MKTQNQNKDEGNFTNLKEQLMEELKQCRAELKEKQILARKKERQMNLQHESIMKLDKQCRKLNDLIYKQKTGFSKSDAENNYTEDDIERLKAELNEAERDYEERKDKYRQHISSQEALIKDYNLELERLNLILKQRNQESRMCKLRINELKRQLRITTNTEIKTRKMQKNYFINPRIMASNLEQLKQDMMAEKTHFGNIRNQTIALGELKVPAKFKNKDKIGRAHV